MITVSPAGPGDTAAIAALLEEMDRFCGATSAEPPGQRMRQIDDACAQTPPVALRPVPGTVSKL